MASPPPNPSPNRKQSLFPTPELSDLVFWEWRDDTSNPVEKVIDRGALDYLDAYHDSTNYPNHKLVYISELNEEGKRRYVYAAERTEQWRYNKEISYPYNERKRFPRITRTTFEIRSQYEASLAETPPATPVSTLDVEYTVALGKHADAKLASEVMRRVPDKELDSYFVLVVRTYDSIPDVTDADDLAELIKFGYRVSYPFADEDFPRVTWTFPIELSAYAHVDLGTTCPITTGEDYSALLLSDQQVAQGDGANIANITRVYDTLPGPTLDTVSKRIEHGIPGKFIVNATLTREETRRATGASPTTPSGDPVDAESVVESVVGPEGSSHYLDRKIDTKWSIVVGGTSDESLDPDTGEMVATTMAIVDAPGTAVDLDANGTYTETRQVSQTKALEITTKASDLFGNPQAWYTTELIYWPAVLEDLFFAPLERFAHPYVRGEVIDAGIYTDYLIKEAGVYPTKVYNELSASLTAPAEEAPVALVPRPINFRFLRFGMNIPATLHPQLTFFEAIGNSDPIYPAQTISKGFAATTYTDWPASYIHEVDVNPWRGGFRKLKRTVYAPTA